jgi:hypothetical protein
MTPTVGSPVTDLKKPQKGVIIEVHPEGGCSVEWEGGRVSKYAASALDVLYQIAGPPPAPPAPPVDYGNPSTSGTLVFTTRDPEPTTNSNADAPAEEEKPAKKKAGKKKAKRRR